MVSGPQQGINACRSRPAGQGRTFAGRAPSGRGASLPGNPAEGVDSTPSPALACSDQPAIWSLHHDHRHHVVCSPWP